MKIQYVRNRLEVNSMAGIRQVFIVLNGLLEIYSNVFFRKEVNCIGPTEKYQCVKPSISESSKFY